MDHETRQELEDIKERLEALEGTLSSVHTSISELVDIYKSMKGFMQVMQWAERISIWLAKIAAAGALIYAALRHTKFPPGPGG